jgi:hypothetical protein
MVNGLISIDLNLLRKLGCIRSGKIPFSRIQTLDPREGVLE